MAITDNKPKTEQLTIIATMTAKPGKAEALGEALRALVPPSRRDVGCINYDLHRSLEDSSVWVMYENWTSIEALKLHESSSHFQHFKTQLADLTTGGVELQNLTKIEC